MKAYIHSHDWADEGDVFFCSIIDEERLSDIKNLLHFYKDLNLIKDDVTIYWGTNEFFYYSIDELMDFADNAVDITEEELAVLHKFGVRGFDIYDQISYLFINTISQWNYRTQRSELIPEVTKEALDVIKPYFIRVLGQGCWDSVIEDYNEQYKV